MSKISFHQINKSELGSYAIIAGQFITCKDTGEIYLDNNNGDRVKCSADITYLTSDSDRTGLLTPVENMIYVVKSTGAIWIYNSGWICLGGGRTTCFSVVLSTASWNATPKTYTISSSSITALSSISIIWDPSIKDIADNCGITITAIASGSCTLTATTVPSYDLYAMIYVS